MTDDLIARFPIQTGAANNAPTSPIIATSGGPALGNPFTFAHQNGESPPVTSVAAYSKALAAITTPSKATNRMTASQLRLALTIADYKVGHLTRDRDMHRTGLHTTAEAYAKVCSAQTTLQAQMRAMTTSRDIWQREAGALAAAADKATAALNHARGWASTWFVFSASLIAGFVLALIF